MTRHSVSLFSLSEVKNDKQVKLTRKKNKDISFDVAFLTLWCSPIYDRRSSYVLLQAYLGLCIFIGVGILHISFKVVDILRYMDPDHMVDSVCPKHGFFNL